MRLDLDAALERVPDYQRFEPVDTLFAHARAVAEAHPQLARYQEAGRSTDGEPIPMVSIGHGERSHLLYACPHPNEPIGAMLVRFLLDELIENEALREGATWHLLPCVDPDGTRLNEGWFAGPYTVRNYAKGFYRPRSEEQVEWTFPVQYKTLSWRTPIPETQALMRAFDQTRPSFVYSLHNAGFGGVYYYLSHDQPDAYDSLRRIPTERGLVMSLGEPEMPWVVEFAPAMYKMSTIREAYDYYETYGSGDPAAAITGGGSSLDYLQGIGAPGLLVTELPYFQSPQVSDTSPTDATRGQTILEGSERARGMFDVLAGLLRRTEGEMTQDSRFLRAVRTFTEMVPKSLEGKVRWAREAPGMDRPATVAQRADELHVGTFYRVLIASMLGRAFEQRLADGPAPAVAAAKAELDAQLDAWIDDIEGNLDYQPLPIRSLVQVQYGAMLALLGAR